MMRQLYATIDNIYAVGRAVGATIVNDTDLQNPVAHSNVCIFHWPPHDEVTRKGVDEQLHDTMIIESLGSSRKLGKNVICYPSPSLFYITLEQTHYKRYILPLSFNRATR